MSPLTLVTSRREWDRDQQNRRGDDDPDREHEMDDDAEGHDWLNHTTQSPGRDAASRLISPPAENRRLTRQKTPNGVDLRACVHSGVSCRLVVCGRHSMHDRCCRKRRPTVSGSHGHGAAGPG
jgi:hypothetical protein